MNAGYVICSKCGARIRADREHGVQLAPGEPTCHLALATSLEKQGRDAEARRE